MGSRWTGAARRAATGAMMALALAAGCAQVKTSADEGSAGSPYAPNPQPAQETELQYRARLHTELGANYYARGQLDVALEEVNEALKLVPAYALAHNVLALVHMELGEYERAESSFRRAIQLAPQDPEIHNNYGWFLCQRGRERDGLAEFDQALRNPLYRTPELAMLNAGRCLLRIGDFRAAESFFKGVNQKQPNHPKAAFGLAEIAYREGRAAEAKALMRSVVPSLIVPETLLLGGCIERRLGDAEAERGYAVQMRSFFPDAPEAAQLAGGKCP